MENVFKVNRPKLEHDKANYGLGDPITLTNEQAEPLLKVGAVLEFTKEDIELAQRLQARYLQEKADEAAKAEANAVKQKEEEAAALAQKKADEAAAAALAKQKADDEAAALLKQKADDEAAQKKAQEDAAALEAQKNKDAAGANKGAAKAKD